jgi:hypothetical protein
MNSGCTGQSVMSEAYQDIAIGFAIGLFFLIAPALWVWGSRNAALSLLKHVFPLTSTGAWRPLVHVRASMDQIVFGSNPPTMRGYTHSCDVQAVIRAFEALEKLPARIEFDYFPEIKAEMKNVIIVGCSSRSSVSNDLGRELNRRNIRVHGKDEHAYFREPSGDEFHCEHIESEGRSIVSKDAAVVMRKVSENGMTILLCGGLHTQGSLAAMEVALSSEFQRKVRKRGLKQFVQFVTVECVVSGPKAGLGIVRQGVSWKNLPLIDLDDGR